MTHLIMESEFTEKVAPPITLPPPEVRMKIVDPKKVPGGPKAIVNAAKRAGLDAWVTYARGPVKHGTQDSYVIKHSMTVRIFEPGTAVVVAGAFYYASYEEGSLEPPKYKLDSSVVRDWTSKFSLQELKAWMRFQPKPRRGP